MDIEPIHILTTGGTIDKIYFDALSDYLAGGSAEHSYAETATRLAMSVSAVKVAAYRLRERYRAALRAAVQETLESAEEIDAEIAWLFQVFQRDASV